MQKSVLAKLETTFTIALHEYYWTNNKINLHLADYIMQYYICSSCQVSSFVYTITFVVFSVIICSLKEKETKLSENVYMCIAFQTGSITQENKIHVYPAFAKYF